MRWFWIDRFVEFESGHRAVAVKNVTLAEEHVLDYLQGYPILPPALIVEGLAQTGGLLVSQHGDFLERVVLAKVSKVSFHQPARPGDTLRYTATVEDLQQDGAIVRGTSHIGETLQAELQLVFAHLDDRFQGVDQFYPADFLQMIRTFGLLDVGRNADGSPLTIPQHLLEAEALAHGEDRS